MVFSQHTYGLIDALWRPRAPPGDFGGNALGQHGMALAAEPLSLSVETEWWTMAVFGKGQGTKWNELEMKLNKIKWNEIKLT